MSTGICVYRYRCRRVCVYPNGWVCESGKGGCVGGVGVVKGVGVGVWVNG